MKKSNADEVLMPSLVDRNIFETTNREKVFGKEIEDNFWACVLLYNNENATGKAIYDTGGRKLNEISQTEKNKHDVQHDITAEKTTLTFEVNSSTGEYLGLNIARDSDKFKEVAGRYQDYITLNKIK